jgi:hypothetical protein
MNREAAHGSPFCSRAPDIVHDLRESRSGTRITFLFTRPSAKCFYPVLVLTHDGSADIDIGWNVAPHRSPDNADLNRDDANCYLYRY